MIFSRLPVLQVRAEPAALQRAPMVPKEWAALIGAVDELIMRVSALESLLEGRSQHLRSAFFTRFFGIDMLPNFRQVCKSCSCCLCASAITLPTLPVQHWQCLQTAPIPVHCECAQSVSCWPLVSILMTARKFSIL